MKFRFNISLPILMSGASEEVLNLKSEFIHKDLTVQFSFTGQEPVLLDSLPAEKRWIRRLTEIKFLVEDVDVGKIEKAKYPLLLNILTSIANRVLQNIRNFGFVLQVKELYPSDADAEHYLRAWNTEMSEDGNNWSAVVPGDAWSSLFLIMSSIRTGQLDASYRPDVEEAIRDNRESPPEQEFFNNSLEYLLNRNYRLAVLESIICLEIVLSQYLNNFLKIHSELPKKRIDDFLSPQLGLYSRISVLLKLCLSPDDTKNIQFDKVLGTISWRNKIIHKSGHLPKNLGDEVIKSNIFSVLELASLLALRRDQIIASPEMRELSGKLATKFSIQAPTLTIVKGHRVIVDYVFFVLPSDLPKEDVLGAIVQETAALLSRRDSRFRPEEHLYVRFSAFPNNVRVRWYKGQFKY